jgi:very-short-patch-repair endonuclease
MIRSLFPVLTYKDKIRQAQFVIAERLIIPIKVVKIGNNERPASQEDIDNAQDELAAIANDPNLTLVTHHAFEMEYVGADGKIHNLSNEFELIGQEILDGVMLNKLLLNGEGPAYSSGQVGLLAMEKRINTFRNEVARWIEQNVFKPVSQWNGFTVEGERGQEEIVYPTIKFDDLDLRDDTGKLQTLVTANQNGVISNVSLMEAFGLNPDQEIERLRFEQGNNFMNDQNFGMPNFSFNMQSGPVTGQGFGAAQAAAPGMPAGGAMPGAAPEMGMTAQTKDQMYKTASEIVNDIYNERLKLNKSNANTRVAGKRFKSAAHEDFLMSIHPVTGRGNLGPLPDEYDGLYGTINAQILGGDNSIPLNNEAFIELKLAENSENEIYRNVYAKKAEMGQPQLFTSIEKMLYSLLLSLNMPYALYAQYSAGPTGDYQLDAAIPSLQIGLEADGGIWHSNPEKIARDKRRDSELAANGWVILRFTDKELKDHPQDCMNVILKAVRKKSGVTSEGKITL